MSSADRKLLSILERAHDLGFRERRLCRRLARLYGLDGRGGPATAPAMIFFRPSFWEVFRKDASQGILRRIQPERIRGLRDKLFAGGRTA